jgi:hypothetical protein
MIRYNNEANKNVAVYHNKDSLSFPLLCISTESHFRPSMQPNQLEGTFAFGGLSYVNRFDPSTFSSEELQFLLDDRAHGACTWEFDGVDTFTASMFSAVYPEFNMRCVLSCDTMAMALNGGIVDEIDAYGTAVFHEIRGKYKASIRDKHLNIQHCTHADVRFFVLLPSPSALEEIQARSFNTNLDGEEAFVVIDESNFSDSEEDNEEVNGNVSEKEETPMDATVAMKEEMP